MAWIEVHQSLPGHRKTLETAAMLHVKPREVVGLIVDLWLWSVDQAPEGDVTHISDSVLAMAAGWEGDATEFAGALTTAGFIERDENGRRIHDWYEYAGKWIEKRKTDAERKKTERGIQSDIPRTSNGHPTDGSATAPVNLNLNLNQEKETSDGENLTPTEREILSTLRSVASYPFDFAKDLAHIRSLALDYPRADLLAQAKKWATYKLDKPLAAKSNPRLQFRTWVGKSEEYAAKNGRPAPTSPAANTRMAEWQARQLELLKMREDAVTPDA